ncbi:MAG: hypothetical protein O3B70_02480 [Bacteroidetes bacterium]|nr:hypothetical protein [Bacteroidota bacterium]MDA0903177.1 hypothetical protein [Bacteroidota bacterium]
MSTPPLFRLIAFVIVIGLSNAFQGQSTDVLNQIVQDPNAVVFPYNPDEDGSGAIGIADLLPFLIYFNNPVEFIVEGNELDEMSLQNVLTVLAQTLLDQAATIDSLQSQLNSQSEDLALLNPLLNLLPMASHFTYSASTQTMVLSGVNLQINNGSGMSYGSGNGLGNLILGYNEVEGGYHLPNGDLAAGEVRTGSHNIILGPGHSYTTNGGLVGGYNNTLSAKGGCLLSGQSSLASGNYAAVLGGMDNRATGNHSCISGGHSNTASGDRASVSGGLLNQSAGIATSILGGQYMQIFEQYETASGQYDINN